MKQSIFYFSTILFAIFFGSQITEGALLLPYWQSLSTSEFYVYYQQFGPSIGRFYSILTILAALIPILFAIYAYSKKSTSLPYALLSSLFALSFVACFYLYFKEANEQFYQAAFDDNGLKEELLTWRKWHWGRVGLEGLSLLFLVLAFQRN